MLKWQYAQGPINIRIQQIFQSINNNLTENRILFTNTTVFDLEIQIYELGVAVESSFSRSY